MQLEWAENMLSFGTAIQNFLLDFFFISINIYSAIQSLPLNHLKIVGMFNKYIPSQNNTVLYSHVFIHSRMMG